MKCTECDSEVRYHLNDRGQQDGFGPCQNKPGKHVVEPKIYYHPGGRDIADVNDRLKFGPLVVLQPAMEYADPQTGAKLLSTPVYAQFSAGKYETSDPEEQYFLDKRGFQTGEEGLKMFRETYWNEKQRIDHDKAELAKLKEETEQVRREHNDLLSQVQKSKQPVAAKAAH